MSKGESVEHHRAIGVTQAESSIRHSASTERLRAAFDGMAVGMILKGAEGETLESNPALRRMLGYGEEELRGMVRSDYTHPEDAGRDAELYRQLLAGERDSFRMEKRYVRKDGSVMWGRLSVSRIEGAEGEPAFAVGVVEDITESREAAQEIERLNRQNRLILDSAGEGIYGLDTEGKTTFVNPAAAAMTGYEPEDMIGKDQHQVIHHSRPDGTSYPREECLIHAAMWDGRVRRGDDDVFWRKDGTSFPVEYTSTPILEDDEIVGTVVTFTDVTERKKAEEALRESEERYRAVMAQSVEAIYLFDAETKRILESNAAFRTLISYAEEELLGMRIYDFIAHDDEDIDRHVRRSLAEKRRHIGERRYRRKDGLVILVDTSASVISYGGRTALCAVSRDVTQRREAEEAVRKSEARLAEAQRLAHLGGWEWDIETDEISWSDEVYRIYGLAPQSSVPSYEVFMEVVDPDDRNRVRKTIDEALHGSEPYDIEHRVVRLDGEIRVVHRRAEVVRGERGEPLRMIGTVHDITERKALEERLEHQALHDSLTGLPNRQLLVDRLKQSLSRTRRRPGRRVAVLFMDLDDFKSINDSLGHDAGDLLLVVGAERLRRCLRPEDTLARFGGDEFVVLLEDIEGPEDAVRVAERITKGLRGSFMLEGRELYISASIGIALGEDRTDSPEDLLRNADTAMYEAKSDAGSGYRVFDPVMHERVLGRLDLENDLRRAIEREEFRLFYQPKFRLVEHERIAEVEALLRWEHPQRGLLMPDEFIPLAEKTGLIVPIGSWVLKEACRQVREWQERHPMTPPLVACVNVAAGQIRYPDLLNDVRSVLEESGIEARSLALEITESALVKDIETSMTVLKELREEGIRFALDDFGSEYSSLSYLMRLPVDFVKIDKSFVWGLGEDPRAAIIVEAIISLAHSLGLEAVGEGVESAEQLESLRSMGCDLVQGYHLAKPLPPEEVPGFLAG